MKDLQTLEREVAEFNAANGIGALVLYRSDPSAKPIETRTTCAAFVLAGHTAVVMVRDVRGCVALSALERKEYKTEGQF